MPVPVGAQAAALAAVIAAMKQPLAFACLVIGVISAVLVGQLQPGRQAPSAPDLPGQGRDDVTFGPDASALPAAQPPAPIWGTLPMPQPDALVPSQRPPTATRLGGSGDPLARLQATPASYGPMPYQVDRSEAVFSVDASIKPADVPEPESWLLLLAGFALVGLGARRRHLATL